MEGFLLIGGLICLVGVLVLAHLQTEKAKAKIREKVKSLGGTNVVITKEDDDQTTLFKVSFSDNQGHQRTFTCRRGQNHQLFYQMPLEQLNTAVPLMETTLPYEISQSDSLKTMSTLSHTPFLIKALLSFKREQPQCTRVYLD